MQPNQLRTILRPARREDNDELLALDQLAAPPGFTPPKRSDFFQRGALYAKAQHWVAERDGWVVGVNSGAVKRMRLSGSMRRTGYAFNARVHPAHRRQGLGMALKDAIEEWFREEGAECSYAYVGVENHINQELLLRRGYTAVATVIFYRVPLPGAAIGGTGGVCLGDIEELPNLLRESKAVLDRYEGVPEDWMERLYRSPGGRYGGSIVASQGSNRAWASIWSEPPDAAHHGKSLFDIGMLGEEGQLMTRGLLAGLTPFIPTPTVTVAVDAQDTVVRAVLEAIAKPVRTEIVMMRWFDSQHPVTNPFYFDVRD